VTPPKTEIIFEFRRVGDYVKVSAIEPITNTEVSIVGLARMDKHALKQTALRKLRYVMEKNAGGGKPRV
jgi:hypothetical protein